MNILLCSNQYAPSVGSVPSVSHLFAEEFTRAGHSVTLVTKTPALPGQTDNEPWSIVRCPSLLEFIRLARQADIVHQNSISLRYLLPLKLLLKPVVVTHQSWISSYYGGLTWRDRLKHIFLRFVCNVVISSAVAKVLPVKSVVIGNPFDKDAFVPFRSMPKERDIVFIGQLSNRKGCDLAMEALAQLAVEGIYASFTIVGDGPEREYLEAFAASRGIADQVRFLGQVVADRGKILAEHKILVVPSRLAEPFGIVALEGIASGCAVVASSGGGLPEAVGPCGLLFPNGNIPALAAALKQLLTDEPLREKLTSAAEAHLEQFDPARIAKAYLEIFEQEMR